MRAEGHEDGGTDAPGYEVAHIRSEAEAWTSVAEQMCHGTDLPLVWFRPVPSPYCRPTPV